MDFNLVATLKKSLNDINSSNSSVENAFLNDNYEEVVYVYESSRYISFNARFYLYVAKCYQKLKNFSAANDVWLIYLDAAESKKDKEYYLNYPLVLMKLNKEAEAKRILLEGLGKFPKSKKIKKHLSSLSSSLIKRIDRIDSVQENEATRALCDFLYFGYVPNSSLAQQTMHYYANLIADDSIETFDASELCSITALLKKIIAEKVDTGKYDLYKIGVTSGLDSRGLLGVLSQLVPEEVIYPFTSGHPGNKDFDLTEHLLKGQFTNYSKRAVHLDASANITPEIKGKNESAFGFTFDAGVSKRKEGAELKSGVGRGLTLHGFLGGALAESRAAGQEGVNSANEYRSIFIKNSTQYLKGKMKGLTPFPEWYDPMDSIDFSVVNDSLSLSPLKQLDLYYRQNQYVRLLSAQQWTDSELAKAPSEIKNKLIAKRRSVFTPYSDLRWQRSFLTLPNHVNSHEFYKHWLKNEFSEIFDDLNHKSKVFEDYKGGTTVISWDDLWVDNLGFKNNVKSIISSLMDRGFWIDPEPIYLLADEKYKGATRLLKGMCAMELNIQAKRLPEPSSTQFRHLLG